MTPPPALAIITQSERMREILDRVRAVAATDGSVLLIGETGVGKELFADYIHRVSPRAAGPFIKVALSAMPHELLESELFGHERGSFTHAVSQKKGLFELASGGSLFLDDIDDVPAAIQPKLLRVLESREVMRVGGTTSIAIDVRLITASKIDLKELVGRGLFRTDLFYRINVVPLEIPPLRERPEDIPLLVEHFLERFAPQKKLAIAPPALRVLVSYAWPGNVRELRNVMQRIGIFASGEIRLEDLPSEIHHADPIQDLIHACSRCFADESMSFPQVVSCLEVNLLRQALKESAGNRAQAAKSLGLSSSTLRDKLKKYGLDGGTETE